METVRYEIQLTLNKNPQNCDDSFCLGSFLTTRSRRYDDNKDSLSEIPSSSLGTQTRSHEVQTDWLALSQTVIRTKCYTIAHIKVFVKMRCSFLHCELNGDCQPERSRVSSELLQSAGDCQSEYSRVLSEFHSCQAADEGEVFQVQDDGFHLPDFHSWSSFFGVFCFLASSILPSLAFHFEVDLPR